MMKKRNALKGLALVTQLGLNMLLPIAVTILLSNWLFPDNIVSLILFVILGIAVAFRNLFSFVSLSGKREKSESERNIVGRPKKYGKTETREDRRH